MNELENKHNGKTRMTYFHVITMLSFNDPFTLILTVINCGFAENKSLVSQLFCPSNTDLNALTSKP